MRGILISLCAIACGPPQAHDVVPADSDADGAPPVFEGRAFPGAEGFGTETPGGRGGAVVIVTTLAPHGPGSLAEALRRTEPRTIVFEVSGVIDFAGERIELDEAQSYVTVAGQSSPGGITLANVTLSSYHTGFHDAVFRFLRIRGPNVSDNLSFAGVHHIVFDHLDVSGGSDETVDITFSRDFTVQWSTITNSTSGPDSQNYGALFAYKPTTRISLHHNLSAHHDGRCGAQMHWAGSDAEPPDGAQIDYRNNVLYNCGFQQLLRTDVTLGTGESFNLIGNYAKAGPDTPGESMMFSVAGDVYLADNTYEGQSLIMSPYFSGALVNTAFEFPPITTTSSTTAFDDVLARAGAWPRDAMNERTVAEVRAGTGQLGNQSDALLTSNAAPPSDTDRDGIPDAWAIAHADPIDPNGYTPLELYLAERAAALIGAP